MRWAHTGWIGRFGMGIAARGLAGGVAARPDLLSTTGSCTLTPGTLALSGDLGDRLNLAWAVSGMTVSGLTLETVNGNGLLIDQGLLNPAVSGSVQTAPDRDDAYRLTVWNDSEYTLCDSPAIAVA